MNPADLAARGIAAGQHVDITSHFQGTDPACRGLCRGALHHPPRCAAAYFPEANVLVPLDSYADKSRTPTSKSIVITVASRAATLV